MSKVQEEFYSLAKLQSVLARFRPRQEAWLVGPDSDTAKARFERMRIVVQELDHAGVAATLRTEYRQAGCQRPSNV